MEESDRTDFKLHCIRIAVEKVKDGQYEDAVRYLEIIQRRSDENSIIVEDFINDLKTIIQKQKTEVTDITYIADSIFIESQLCLVQEVLKQQNFYTILNVTKDANEMEIKKSYKRLLLQLHPDKNCSPDASLAFQLVNKAFAVLSDKGKRQRYDDAGGWGTNFIDSCINTLPHAPKPPSKKHGFKKVIFDALLTGPNSMSKSMYAFSGVKTKALLGSVVVAVILALATIFSNQSNRQFAFSATSKLTERQVTHRFHIPYYVKADFLKTYNDDLMEFEKDIETQFITLAEMKCENERRERDNAMVNARQARKHWEYARISSIRLKSCAVLMRLGLYRYHQPT